MRIDIVTIFPDYLAPLKLSLIGKARREGLLDIRVHDLRASTHDRHHSVDDAPFGGGAGMVMRPQPWAEALARITGGPTEADSRVRTQGAPGSPDAPAVPHLIVPGPGGTPFTQQLAGALAKEPWLAFACGRYEGIDERVYEHAAARMPVSVMSLGDYVLNGGEVAVLAMVEAIGRLLPGVIGNAESLIEESHEDGLLEYPVYTRPAVWDDHGTAREVPPVLLSGDHAAIAVWRHQQRLDRTAERRPDLLPISATIMSAQDWRVAPADPADAAELLVLQRACWLPEGREADSWQIPALLESLDEVAASLVAASGWTTWLARTPTAGDDPGRLVGSVRARRRPGEEPTWEISRLMLAPDVQDRGLGQALLRLAENQAPPGIRRFCLLIGAVSARQRWIYGKAGYRRAPGESGGPGTLELTKRVAGGHTPPAGADAHGH
ncbi:MAG: tRNA (guanosine(37)-N1)-methyltransferase TrmD [Nostocoides sp.]